MTVLPRTPSFRLDGRRALVTGASSGIGLAAAAALAEARAHVHLVARRPAELETLRDALRASGAQADATALDITLPIATLRAVGVLADPEGDRVILRRDRAPDVMASGALPPAAAREAAAALAWRLGISNEAGPGAWIHMAARTPHSLVAQTPVVMLLLLLKSRAGSG